MTMIDKLTLGELKEIKSMLKCSDGPGGNVRVGEKILIRGVTLYYVGRVEKVSSTEIVLSTASWVADTGKFNKALTTGELSEVEPYPNGVIVNRGAVMDISPWDHELPTKAK
jgi:hypothetical protein